MLLSRLFFYEKFRSLNNYALICRLNEEKHKKKHTMNNFLKNLGILLIVLGTAVLVLSYVCNWLDYNWPNGIALLAIVWKKSILLPFLRLSRPGNAFCCFLYVQSMAWPCQRQLQSSRNTGLSFPRR